MSEYTNYDGQYNRGKPHDVIPCRIQTESRFPATHDRSSQALTLSLKRQVVVGNKTCELQCAADAVCYTYHRLLVARTSVNMERKENRAIRKVTVECGVDSNYVISINSFHSSASSLY